MPLFSRPTKPNATSTVAHKGFQRRNRRGNYIIITGFAALPLLGMGAFSVDLAMLALAQSECQDIADAAADAGLIALRNTGDKDFAKSIASEVVKSNLALNGIPTEVAIEVGRWDEGDFTADGVDDEEEARSNSVRVDLSTDVDFVLAPLLNNDRSTVRAEAVAAARPVELILVMDITNSWQPANFTSGARAAAIRAYDLLGASAGPEDKLGMVVFTGRYGVEHTPLMTYAQHATVTSASTGLTTRDDWLLLNLASKGTSDKPSASQTDTKKCGSNNNNFGLPSQECYPNMWREYADESGTDHSMGLQMAGQIFGEQSDSGAYRAVIILTDGSPNGTGAHNQRTAAGYTETRWRFIKEPGARDKDAVIAASIDMSTELNNDYDANIWAISFVANANWMDDVAQGEGYYKRVSSPNELVPLFQSIVESLPVALVR